MEIALRVPGCAPANESAAFALRVEEAGFDGMGIPDTQLIMRDVYVTLALAAQNTSNLKLYTAVTNPVTRHFSVLASLVQTVEELAPGRIGIIIGSGYSAVRTIGQPRSTLDMMRKCVLTVRSLLAGEQVDFDGFHARLPFAAGRRTPLIIAASGPKTLELAGEVADGVLISAGLHPAMLDAAMERVEAGARRAGRNLGSVEVMHAGRVHISPDMETAHAMARPVCAQWVMEPYRASWLKKAGIEVPDFEIPPELLALYPDIPHAEDWDEARRLTSFLSDDMVAEMCDAIGLFGPPDHVASRLGQLRDYGISRFFVQTTETYSFPESTLEAFRDSVLPQLRG